MRRVPALAHGASGVPSLVFVAARERRWGWGEDRWLGGVDGKARGPESDCGWLENRNAGF